MRKSLYLLVILTILCGRSISSHAISIGGTDVPDGAVSFADTASWIELGTVFGQPTSIDIDSVTGITHDDLYSFVRIRDIPPSHAGPPYDEADIDTVGAISSAPPVKPVPEPATLILLGSGLIGLAAVRRRINK